MNYIVIALNSYAAGATIGLAVLFFITNIWILIPLAMLAAMLAPKKKGKK